MPLLPSLLPFPKVNTRCINKREELLSTRNLINHPKKKKGFVPVCIWAWAHQPIKGAGHGLIWLKSDITFSVVGDVASETGVRIAFGFIRRRSAGTAAVAGRGWSYLPAPAFVSKKHLLPACSQRVPLQERLKRSRHNEWFSLRLRRSASSAYFAFNVYSLRVLLLLHTSGVLLMTVPFIFVIELIFFSSTTDILNKRII